jgi:beta-fructofuranosidase
MRVLCYTPLLAALLSSSALAAERPASAFPLTDKTLVVWCTPASLSQRGGSVLTIENPGNVFDAIVLGEIAPGRWMAGSDNLVRTEKKQDAWPAETAGFGKLVQIAIAYRGNHVSIYRDGQPYADYTMVAPPVAFGKDSVVLLGLRHREANTPRFFTGTIDDARIYNVALDPAVIASLKPNQPSDPQPLAWWSFANGKSEDLMKTFPVGRLVGRARIEGGKLHLPGGESYLIVGAEPPRTRATEDWPTWHVTALPEEGRCQPYDANGCIFWKGKYHLMYIFQKGAPGHSWGHATSADLVNWTFHPATLAPAPGDPDKGIFSGNAFINKEGKPMLCWFGIDAGVCVATAADGDDNLIRWKKHPKNPIIPIPKPGEPAFGLYKVWDPYLWLEGDTYYCLLGGNHLPNGKDTLYLLKSPDLVHWTPLHPFYEHPDLSWTTSIKGDADILKSEDCSCPDFFKLGNKRVLLCISHMIGGRCYVGRYEKETFYPEQHVRMNWSGGAFFAPESLEDAKGRRIFWAWAIDPRIGPTRDATGSGAMTMPRVLSLDADGTLRISPAAELQSLRRNPRTIDSIPLAANEEVAISNVRGDSLELALEIDPGQAREVGVKVRCSPDGREETVVAYDTQAKTLKVDMSRSTLRPDVLYGKKVLETVWQNTPRDGAQPVNAVEAPFALRAGELLRLRVFLDRPMLEVFANDRQCITQQIFPASREALTVKAFARGGAATLRAGEAWDMAPAKFINEKSAVSTASRRKGAR